MAKRASRLVSRLEGKGVFRRRAHSALELLRVRDLMGANNDVLDLDDPLPFLLEVERQLQERRRPAG
jgi:hypothetical protein